MIRKIGIVLRRLLAIAILPLTVTIVIPLSIVRRDAASIGIRFTGVDAVAEVAGAAVAAVGLLLFVESLRYFVVKGRGTLAPWDPPKHLVVEGPYRYVRNPMISGVLFILFGQALLLRLWALGRWAMFFLIINLIYIPALEEPMLQQRFGDPYREYRRHVRRFLPRMTPWSPYRPKDSDAT